jgi:hypothetical protein
MSCYDLKFCSAFSYPSSVREQLTRVLDLVLESGVDVRSVLVTGSTARGELSYTSEEKTFRLFSDYELLLVTPEKIPRNRRDRLELEVNQLGHLLNPDSPLFHIDLGWCALPRLPLLPHVIAAFELKEMGKVVWGEDYRHLMPVITAESLDKKKVDEILYKRLWALLLYLPREFFDSCLTLETVPVTTYVLVRNALDLTTVLLPHEGVLLPTYAQRVRCLAENYANTNLRTTFGADFPRFLATCLTSRRTLTWKGSLLQLYLQIVDYLEQALGYLLAKQGYTAYDVGDSIVTQSRLLFREYLPKRAKVGHALRVLWGQHSLQKAYRWPGLPHKGILTACLLQMHRAMIAHLSGDQAEAYAVLERAQSLLEPLISRRLSRLDPDEPFTARWLSLRRDCGYFWWEFVRGRRPVFCDRIRALME